MQIDKREKNWNKHHGRSIEENGILIFLVDSWNTLKYNAGQVKREAFSKAKLFLKDWYIPFSDLKSMKFAQYSHERQN